MKASPNLAKAKGRLTSLHGARLSSPACRRQRLRRGGRRSRQSAAEALAGSPHSQNRAWPVQGRYAPAGPSTLVDYYSPISLRLYPSAWGSHRRRDGPGRGHTSPSAAGLQQEDGLPRARGYPGMAATGGDREQPWRHGPVGQQLWNRWLGVITASGCTPEAGTGCPAEWSAGSRCMLRAGRPTRR